MSTEPTFSLSEVVPARSADEIAADISEALSAGLPHPDRLLNDYLTLMSAGDAGCPGDDEQLTDSVVYGCYSSGGYYYIGVAEHYESGGFRAFGGDFRIDTPDGETMRGGGGMELTHSGDAWSVLMGGSWVWSGSADPWLADGGSLWLEVDADPGGFVLFGAASMGEHDVSVQGVTYDAAAEALTGPLQLRGEDGLWYTMDLTGGGCGGVSVEGMELGEACAEIGPLVSSVLAIGQAP